MSISDLPPETGHQPTESWKRHAVATAARELTAAAQAAIAAAADTHIPVERTAVTFGEHLAAAFTALRVALGDLPIEGLLTNGLPDGRLAILLPMELAALVELHEERAKEESEPRATTHRARATGLRAVLAGPAAKPLADGRLN